MDKSLNVLVDRKGSFLYKVSQDVESYIVSQGCHCIDIVEKGASPEKEDVVYRTWRASIDPDFCKVLYRFVRHKLHNNHTLDSALTKPVCDIVTECYVDFYQENADTISAGVLAVLTNDNLILDSFLNRVVDKALSKVSSQVRKRIVHEVLHQIHSSTTDGALHVVSHQISAVAATTAGAQVTAILAHVLVKLLAGHIGIIVAKLLATPLIHKLAMILLKKAVIAAVGGAVLNFLAAHVSAAIGGSSIMWVAMPLLVVYIGYKIATFPETIGEEVAKKVREDLSGRFTPMNKTILDNILEKVIDGEELVAAIAKDKEFTGILKDLAEGI